MKPRKISKLLSANDTGETGGHQAGILVPKNPDILGFFPELDPSVKNPRWHLHFTDDVGKRWEFAFIYYNNRSFGGTRNEYRLTRMTPYIQSNGLKAGDEVVFERSEDGSLFVNYSRANSGAGQKLKLSGQWKVIDI